MVYWGKMIKNWWIFDVYTLVCRRVILKKIEKQTHLYRNPLAIDKTRTILFCATGKQNKDIYQAQSGENPQNCCGSV